MHTTIQQRSNHSSKPMNGTTATSPLKDSPNSVQSGTYHSRPRGKKKDRGNQYSDSTKQERPVKHYDGDSGQSRSESSLKSELAKLSDKGGLVDSESVERLVQLMQPDKSHRKIDLSCRSMIAGIIAATHEFDCLNQFVLLRGFLVLDEWLQEVHKGKTSNSGALKDSGKSVDDFLMVLLRALDKLPINLNALKLCNIGKSVNHLRSHKNLEIQRKSRGLVDTWKKRVEEEMNSDEIKSASSQAVPWPGRPRHEVSHGGHKHAGLSSTSTTKSLGHVASSKSASVKHVQGETSLRASSLSSGLQKSSSPPTSMAANLEEGQTKTSVTGGYSELPQATAKVERSSSSGQSHTNSQCSSDLPVHVRNPAAFGKEDARSSTARSKSINKFIDSSRCRKSANSLHGTSSGVQKVAGSGRISALTRLSDSVKSLQSNIACENAPAASVVEGSSHKIIEKISNQGRNPGKSTNTGSAEAPSCKNSRASSPEHSEKLDQSDSSLREKDNASQIDEVDGLPPDGKQCRTGMESVERPDASSVTCSSSGKKTSSGLLDSSLSPMNALIENCLKYSEAITSAPAGDDIGMNLLASVPAGEVSKRGSVSLAVSPLRNTSKAGNRSTDCEGTPPIIGAASKKSSEDLLGKEESSLKTVGKLVEFVGDASLSVSSACIVDKSANSGDERIPVSKPLVKNESQDPVTYARMIAGSSLPVEEVVQDEVPMEIGPGKDPDYAVQFVSSRHDDQKSSSITELSTNAVIEYKQVSLKSSGHVNANEGQALEHRGDNPQLVPESSTNLKVESSIEKNGSKVSDVSENQETKQDGEIPINYVKGEESSLVSAYSEQKTESRIEISEKNDVASHSYGPCSKDLFPCEETKPDLSSKNSVLTAVKAVQNDESSSSAANTSLSVAVVFNTDKKLEFDLNEGINMDDVKNAEQINIATPPFPNPTPVSLMGPSHSSSVPSPTGSLPAAVTVAAAAKRPFVPPEDLLWNKTELGWKGLAATSAFHPAEPSKIPELPTGSCHKVALHDIMAPKQVCPALNFDLNVTDEQILLDMGCQNSAQEINQKPDGMSSSNLNGTSKVSSLRSSVGFELDLNRVDDSPELGQPSKNSSQRLEASGLSVGSSSGEFGAKQDFDLNDGPSQDESTAGPVGHNQYNLNNVPPQSPFGLRMNNPVLGNLPSWYSPGTTYSAVTIPSALPDSRGSQPFLITGAGGPQRKLSFPAGWPSSLALPFGTTTFQYSVFPFGTSSPLPAFSLPVGSGALMNPSSGVHYCAAAAPNKLARTGHAGSSHFLCPCVVSLPNVNHSSGVIESSGKWSRQGLDLNSGPGVGGVGRRDEAFYMASRQLPPQVLTEDLARMYHVPGGGLKRKEPEGGWET